MNLRFFERLRRMFLVPLLLPVSQSAGGTSRRGRIKSFVESTTLCFCTFHSLPFKDCGVSEGVGGQSFLLLE